MTDEINLHDTTDATAWASEFCKIWPSALCQIEGKEGVSDGEDFEHTMVGWFANAIMAGVDSQSHIANARIAELEAALGEVSQANTLSKAQIIARAALKDTPNA